MISKSILFGLYNKVVSPAEGRSGRTTFYRYTAVDESAADLIWPGVEVNWCNAKNCQIDNVVTNKLYIRNCQFVSTRVTQTSLDFSLIENSKFEYCKFKQTSFASAQIRGSLFSECRFEYCDFSGADLSQPMSIVDFSRCVFVQCRFNGAKFGSVGFNYCDVRDIDFELVRVPYDYATPYLSYCLDLGTKRGLLHSKTL